MSFTLDVKEELCTLPINHFTAKAEFAGFLKFKGTLEIGRFSHFELTVKDTCVARRVKKLLKIMHQGNVDIFYRQEKRLNAGRLFLLRIAVENVREFLNELGLNTIGEVNERTVSDPILFAAFMRGAFLSSGSIANPVHHHHLEIYYRKLEALNWILKRLENFFGIIGHIVDVSYGYRFYIKNGEMIEEFLNLIGAMRAANLVHSVMMANRIRSDVTRSVNFIEANSKRSGTASLKQIDAIMEIDRRIGLKNLPPKLYKVAKLRLENPAVSLRELGSMLTPPVSKSVVHRRLGKILKMVQLGEDKK